MKSQKTPAFALSCARFPVMSQIYQLNFQVRKEKNPSYYPLNRLVSSPSFVKSAASIDGATFITLIAMPDHAKTGIKIPHGDTRRVFSFINIFHVKRLHRLLIIH